MCDFDLRNVINHFVRKNCVKYKLAVKNGPDMMDLILMLRMLDVGTMYIYRNFDWFCDGLNFRAFLVL